MGSDSLFTKCKTCGKEISKSAKACPQCGEKQKKLSIIQWIGVAFFGLMIIGVASSPDDKTQPNESNLNKTTPKQKAQLLEMQMPNEQLKFVQVVTEHAAGFREAKNELQQFAIRDQRKIAISSSLGGYSVSSWVGTINQLETNTEGKAILSVRISPDIEIKTLNNAFSDIGSNTLIEKGTPTFNSLFNLTNGQRVRFSGAFLPSKSDFIEERSMTIDGSIKNPEFLFKFQSISPIN
jgi:RNA polymerase subunit RPABC4/transcription elongation factor Spt4